MQRRQSQPENIPGRLLLYKEFPELQALLLLYTVGGHYKEPGATSGTQEEALVPVKSRMKPLCCKVPKEVVSNLVEPGCCWEQGAGGLSRTPGCAGTAEITALTPSYSCFA